MHDLHLLATELVTNAVLHADVSDAGTLEMRVMTTPRRWSSVSVTDPGDAATEPEMQPLDLAVPGGMGLFLVDQISSALGLRADARGREPRLVPARRLNVDRRPRHAYLRRTWRPRTQTPKRSGLGRTAVRPLRALPRHRRPARLAWRSRRSGCSRPCRARGARRRLRLRRHDAADRRAGRTAGEAVGVDVRPRLHRHGTSRDRRASARRTPASKWRRPVGDLGGPYDMAFSRIGTMFFATRWPRCGTSGRRSSPAAGSRWSCGAGARTTTGSTARSGDSYGQTASASMQLPAALRATRRSRDLRRGRRRSLQIVPANRTAVIRARSADAGLTDPIDRTAATMARSHCELVAHPPAPPRAGPRRRLRRAWRCRRGKLGRPARAGRGGADRRERARRSPPSRHRLGDRGRVARRDGGRHGRVARRPAGGTHHRHGPRAPVPHAARGARPGRPLLRALRRRRGVLHAVVGRRHPWDEARSVPARQRPGGARVGARDRPRRLPGRPVGARVRRRPRARRRACGHRADRRPPSRARS